MIVDIHNHVGIRVGRSQSGAELIKKMDRAGVDKAVIFSFVEQPDDDFIAREVVAFPDRLVGFACVNPWMRDAAVSEIERSVTKLGLKGLKLHPLLHGAQMDNIELMGPIFDKCEKLGVPIIAHSGDSVFSLPIQFEEIARVFPKVTLIMAHAGFMQSVGQARRAAKRCPNIILDMCAGTSVDITDAVAEIGPERVVMGSDSPFTDVEVEMLKVKLAVPDVGIQKMILGGNAARILGLK
jgi:predicted TIM-barrel fold metal-dependent hydrolase